MNVKQGSGTRRFDLQPAGTARGTLRPRRFLAEWSYFAISLLVDGSAGCTGATACG